MAKTINGTAEICKTCSDKGVVARRKPVWLGWALKIVLCPDCKRGLGGG